MSGEELLYSAADQMLRSTSSTECSSEKVLHGKGSAIGVDSTFAKGGSRRNYSSQAHKTRLA